MKYLTLLKSFVMFALFAVASCSNDEEAQTSGQSYKSPIQILLEDFSASVSKTSRNVVAKPVIENISKRYYAVSGGNIEEIPTPSRTTEFDHKWQQIYTNSINK